MTKNEYIEALAADKSRYDKSVKRGFELVKKYRKCKYYKGKSRFLSDFARFRYNKFCTKCNVSIPSSTEIGSGFKINHTYGIAINSKTVIGKNFSMKCNTVIGGTPKGAPVIGDNVSLGVNVVIIGPVKIGNGVDIGAGAVVTHDIPDNAVAVGNPARVLKIKETSESLIV